MNQVKFVDDRIKEVKDWLKKYPGLTIVPSYEKNDFYKYEDCNVNDKSIREGYKNVLQRYDYLRSIAIKGKMTSEQLEEVYSANIGGEFGYNDYVIKLSNSFNVSIVDAAYVVNKYGNLENLFKKENKNELDKRLIKEFDKHVCDLDETNDEHVFSRIATAIIGIYNCDLKNNYFLFTSDKLKEAIDKLNETEKRIIKEKFYHPINTMPATNQICRKLNMPVDIYHSNLVNIFRKLCILNEINPFIIDFTDYINRSDISLSKKEQLIDSHLKIRTLIDEKNKLYNTFLKDSLVNSNGYFNLENSHATEFDYKPNDRIEFKRIKCIIDHQTRVQCDHVEKNRKYMKRINGKKSYYENK